MAASPADAIPDGFVGRIVPPDVLKDAPAFAMAVEQADRMQAACLLEKAPDARRSVCGNVSSVS